MESILAKSENRYEVADGNQSHEKVAETPYKIEAGNRTEHDHHAAGNHAQEDDCRGTMCQETHVGLAIVVIADNAAESEEEDGYGDEDRTGTAHLAFQRTLREQDSRLGTVGVDTADNDDEGRAACQ